MTEKEKVDLVSAISRLREEQPEMATGEIADLLSEDGFCLSSCFWGRGHSLESIIEVVMGGGDLDHLDCFVMSSHYGDLYDQPDGLNSTESGLY